MRSYCVKQKKAPQVRQASQVSEVYMYEIYTSVQYMSPYMTYLRDTVIEPLGYSGRRFKMADNLSSKRSNVSSNISWNGCHKTWCIL